MELGLNIYLLLDSLLFKYNNILLKYSILRLLDIRICVDKLDYFINYGVDF